MGELILKNNIHQDWVSLIFFINLLFISWMFFLDPLRLRGLIKFYAIDFYISKFISEKKLNYLSPFNLLSFFIIINAVCLYIFSFSNFSNKLIKFSSEYYYLMITMFVLLSLRFFFIQSILNHIKSIKKSKLLYFKSFTQNVQFSIILLIFLFFHTYNSFSKHIFITISGCVGVCWFYYQIKIFISLFRLNPKEFLYIILYLCTLKIIPWYWFYVFIIESKL
jgi:hypothetical protein